LNEVGPVPKRKTDYQSYLLRLRRVDNAGQPVWRFSLESPGSHERRVFGSLEELFAFLETQIMDVGRGHEGSQRI
jgi:hypothetical protein